MTFAPSACPISLQSLFALVLWAAGGALIDKSKVMILKIDRMEIESPFMSRQIRRQRIKVLGLMLLTLAGGLIWIWL